MNTETSLKQILHLILNQDTTDFTSNTPLLGHYAELDSMGIMTLLMDIESTLNIDINNIDLAAENFETFGALLACIELSANQLQSIA